MPTRVDRQCRQLGALLAICLSATTATAAELTPAAAAERYQHWSALPAAEQPTALADLAEHYSSIDADKALELAEAGLQRTTAATPPALIAQLQNSRSFALFASGNSTEALTGAIATEKLASEQDLPHARGRARTIQGYVFRNAGLTERALIAHHGALQDFDAAHDLRNKAKALRNVAAVLISLRQFEQAESYVEQIRKLSQPGSADEPLLQAAIGDLNGHMAALKNHFADALQQHQHALRWAIRGNDLISQHVYHAAIGADLLELKRPAEALQMAERGLALIRATGNDFRDISLYQIKAMALAALNRFDEAEQLLQQSLVTAERRNDQNNRVTILQYLSTIEKRRGHFEKALQYLEAAGAAEILAADKRNVERTAILDATFDSERKGRQIELLQAENRVQQLEIEQQKHRQVVMVTIGILVLTLLAFYYFRRQHRLALQRQQQLNAKLRELDAIKDRMLANTSHELRTPLNGIVGLSELLLAEQLDTQVREYVELIADSGRRLSRVVTDLLESARLQQGKVQLHCAPLDLHEPVRKAMLICLPLAQQKQLSLQDRLPAALPAVWADSARIQQVLINLLTNAIKFTEQGSIMLSARVNGDALQVLVEDTGIGVPAAMQQRIFESFVQADGSMTRKHEGAGLGLAISKQLIELHGGTVGVSSRDGNGSAFWFTLPLAPAASQPPVRPAALAVTI